MLLFLPAPREIVTAFPESKIKEGQQSCFVLTVVEWNILVILGAGKERQELQSKEIKSL